MILGDTIFTHKDTVVQYKVPYKISLLLTIFMYYYYTNFELFMRPSSLSSKSESIHSNSTAFSFPKSISSLNSSACPSTTQTAPSWSRERTSRLKLLCTRSPHTAPMLPHRHGRCMANFGMCRPVTHGCTYILSELSYGVLLRLRHLKGSRDDVQYAGPLSESMGM